jgi:photosystem II stability/assembly factor-like uncharacterized protein
MILGLAAGALLMLVVVTTLWQKTVATAAQSKTPTDSEYTYSLVVHPQSETLLVGTHSGLFRSRDAGVTWERVQTIGEVPGRDFTSLVMHPQQYNLLYASGHNLGILRSHDFGLTWQRVDQGIPSADVPALAIDPHKPQQLYAWVVEQGLFRSRDGGRSWQRAEDGPPNPEVRSLASVNIPNGMGGIYIYAGTTDGVYKNTDCF